MKKQQLKIDKKTVTKLNAKDLNSIEGGVVTSCTPNNNCCGDGGSGDDPFNMTKFIKFQ